MRVCPSSLHQFWDGCTRSCPQVQRSSSPPDPAPRYRGLQVRQTLPQVQDLPVHHTMPKEMEGAMALCNFVWSELEHPSVKKRKLEWGGRNSRLFLSHTETQQFTSSPLSDHKLNPHTFQCRLPSSSKLRPWGSPSNHVYHHLSHIA